MLGSMLADRIEKQRKNVSPVRNVLWTEGDKRTNEPIWTRDALFPVLFVTSLLDRKFLILASFWRMKPLLGSIQNNLFRLASWTSVHIKSCLCGSLFGHLFRVLNIHRHDHTFASYQKKCGFLISDISSLHCLGPGLMHLWRMKSTACEEVMAFLILK